MEDQLYREQILDHYKRPHNFGRVEKPDLEFEDTNPFCGDEQHVTIRLDEDVLDYFVSDVPIGRFKFVEQGETLGLAFDGLIFVNDHWVFMPKPWRALPEQ